MSYSGGSGTSGDPYQIAVAGDWAALCGTSGDWAAGTYFMITADINFGGASILCVGGGRLESGKFEGSFEGNGKTFSNFTLPGDDDTGNSTALFRMIASSGIVKNLNVSGATVVGVTHSGTSVSTYGAVICGELSAGGVVSNCSVTSSTVTMTYNTASYPDYFGIVVGACHGNVTDCSVIGGSVNVSATANNTGTSNFIGGVVGYLTGTDVTNGTIMRCRSSATVTNNGATASTTVSYIGGICGSQNAGTISDCHFTGTITYLDANALSGTTSSIGGVTGWCNSGVAGDINKCSAVCSITVDQTGATKDCRIGGLAGRMGAATIENSFANTAISLKAYTDYADYVSGLVGFTASGAGISNCYAKGSFYDARQSSPALFWNICGGLVGDYVAGGTIDKCYVSFAAYTANPSAYHIEGFVGVPGTASSITNCFWEYDTGRGISVDAAATGTTYESTVQMKTLSTFTSAGWDFTSTGQWAMAGYPVLSWENYGGVFMDELALMWGF